MTEYLMIGEVLKPQGIRGEVKIRPYAADVERFRGWKTLYRKAEGAFLPLECRVNRSHEGFVYAVLDGCSSMEESERLRGMELYIDRAHAAPLDKNAVYIADLIGCEAKDEAGNSLGVLRDVLQHGSVDTWVFLRDGKTWMAPALKEVFPEVDPEARLIAVCSARLEEVAVFED